VTGRDDEDIDVESSSFVGREDDLHLVELGGRVLIDGEE